MTTTNPATTGPVLHPDLTPAQRDCLDALPLTGNHLVSGPPGSGKSLLAAHRAVHLALTGRPTVLLTRSKLLCRLLQATLDDLTVPGAAIEASTAHAWIMRRYGRGAVRTADGWFDWTELTGLAAATIDASETTVTPHLVVDEGQDLPPGFYRMVRLSAVSTTVFADECQRLTETNSTLNEIASTLGHSTSRVEISGNHRNTREIASSPNTSESVAHSRICRSAAARFLPSVATRARRTSPTTSPAWLYAHRSSASVSS